MEKEHSTGATSSPDFHRIIFENANDAIFIIDSETYRIIDANRTALERLGYTREELVRMRVPDLHPKAEESLTWQVNQKLQEGKRLVISDTYHRRKDGTLIPVDIRASLITVDGRRYNVAIVTDLSEKRQAEQYFRVLFEKASDGIYLADAKTMRFLEVNEEGCRALGYTREELLKLGVPDVAPDLKEEQIDRIRERILEGKGPSRVLENHRRKDGTTFPVEVRISRTTLAGRECLLATARDITEQIRAGKELEEAKAFLEHVQESAGDGLMLVNDRGAVVAVNGKMAEMRELEREELVGRPVTDLAGPEERERFEEALARLGKGESIRLRTHRRTESGRDTIFDITASPLERGGKKYAFAIVRDVTEQVQAEEALRLVVQGTAGATGEDFFRSLVRHLASALQVRYALVARCVDTPPTRVRTLAFWAGDRFGEELDYELKGTPCEGVMFGKSCTYVEDVQRAFPMDDALKTLQVDGYMGVPLEEAEGGGIGHLVVMHDGPLFDVDRKMAILKIFAARAGAELVRRDAEEALQENATRLRLLAEQVPAVLWTTDAELKFTSSQGTGLALLGLKANQVVGMTLWEYLQTDDPANPTIAAALRSLKGESTTFEFTWEGYTWSTRTEPLRDAEGRIVGVIGVSQDVSEQKRVEVALRGSEERWRSLVANAPDHIMTVDREGHILSINYTVPELTPDQVIGRKVYDFMDPDSHEVSRRSIEKIFRKGESASYEVSRIGPDGEPQWFTTRLGPVREGDRVVAAVMIATNTTEQKKAEQELAKLAQEQGLLLSHTRDFVYRHDVNGVFTYMSPSVEQITGHQVEHWMTHYTEYLTDHPDNRKVIDYTEETLRTGKQSPPYLVEIHHREGRRITLEVSERAYYEGGEIAGIVGVARDVTERLKVEEEVRFQKSLLESTSEAAIDGILVVSTEGKMVSFNRRFLQIWDIPPEIAESRSDEAALKFVLNKLTDPEEFLRRVQYLYAHPTEESHEEILLKDGRTLDRFSAPVRSREGTIYGRVWYFRDISGRKRSEEELRRAAEETRKAYEGLKRAQAQLIRSEKLASVGMLVSGVAHELNNPLNVMYGNLRLLSDACKELSPLAREGARRSNVKGVPARIRKFKGMIADALKSAEHARGIVEDFRGFARDVRTAEPVDLNRCLEEALTLIQQELRPRIKLVKRLRKLPTVRCLRGQISQVFLNLLTNAAEAIDHRGTITLRTLQQNGRVVVEVADTGRGMPEEIRRKLFEPFFTTKPQGKGMGLGLSISAMIVQNHGGELLCRSKPGKGSVFRVELPVRS